MHLGWLERVDGPTENPFRGGIAFPGDAWRWPVALGLKREKLQKRRQKSM
jgi:hypothetical protein